MSPPSWTLLAGIAVLTVLSSLAGCSKVPAPAEAAANEPTGTVSQKIVVAPGASQQAQNRSAVAFFQGSPQFPAFQNRTYVAWVGIDANHSVNVASTAACPADTWTNLQPTTFGNGEHGSDDVKAGVGLAPSADGQRLYLVYTGLHPNNVYLKWMFIDDSSGTPVEHWSAPMALPGSGTEDDAPSIAVNGDSIYVAFTDTDNTIDIDRADAPTGPPQASDTITFDPQPVVLPNGDQGHRSDYGPSITFYNSNFTDPSQPAKDNLLLAYTTQTQCVEPCNGIEQCQACRQLVIDFLDRSSPLKLSQPYAVEFSRVYSDAKDVNDFEAGPAILGVTDQGLAVAFRQDRGNKDQKSINFKLFSDSELQGLYAEAVSAGRSNIYGGDSSGERGVPFRVGVNQLGQFTPNDPNLGALSSCSPAPPSSADAGDAGQNMDPALVWPGTQQLLNVTSSIQNVATTAGCLPPLAFDDTTDHTPAYANALFSKREKAVIEEFACGAGAVDPTTGKAMAGASPAVMARLALSSVNPAAGPPGMDHCAGNPSNPVATQEAEAWICQQSCINSSGAIDIGTGQSLLSSENAGWDVNSIDYVRLFYQWPAGNDDVGTRKFLLQLVDGSSQNCNGFHTSPVGPIHSADESVQGFAHETENHLLNIESNRYLYNQAKSPSDNTVVNDDYTAQEWLQKKLQAISQLYFYEYNSPAAYSEYSAESISNLFEYSQDPSIKTGARMVLDLLAAHEALATKDLRRMTPFRRHPLDWDPEGLLPSWHPNQAWNDVERDRYELLSGESRMVKDSCPDAQNMNVVATALGSYRIPDPILDRLLNRRHQKGFGRIHLANRGSTLMHSISDSDLVDGWETFFQDPDFLISGGGIATYNQYTSNCGLVGEYCAAENENGQDVWTTVMPTGTVTNSALTLHVEQPRELTTNEEYILDEIGVPPWRKTCVGPNFACGVHVVIPDSLCQEKRGPFTFVDFTKSCVAGLTSDANENHGFYAAVFSSDDWGFFEVEGVTTIGASVATLQQFEEAVLARNGSGSFSSGGTNTYTTLQGDTLRFAPVSLFSQWNLTGLTRNCDAAVNPSACRAQVLPVVDGTAPSFDSWLAEGDFMTNTDPATGIRSSSRRWTMNPYTCQQIIMDYADSTNPFYVDPQNTGNRLCDSGGSACVAPCTSTPTGACSCPTTTMCNPPADVTGSMSLDACNGFLAQFKLGEGNCPVQTGLWSARSDLGNDTAVVAQSGGASGIAINDGAQRAGPAVGFEIDFPPPPAMISVGCSAGAAGAPATCGPVGPNGVLDLAPGRYASITVGAGGTLVLHPGDTMFDALELDPGATLYLPAGQQVRVLTKASALLGADVACFDASGTVKCDPDGTASSFGLMHLGTSPVFAKASLAGTIVAPNATITVLPGGTGDGGDCSFTVTQNDYDGLTQVGTIGFTNDGPGVSSNYSVGFDLPAGEHCTVDTVPPGATLSPLAGPKNRHTVSNHCIFSWVNAPPVGADGTVTFHYSTDGLLLGRATNVAVGDAVCNGGGVACNTFTLTTNRYDRAQAHGTISFTNDGPSSASAYQVEFDVPAGAHCLAAPLPSGASLFPLSGTSSPDHSLSNHCVFVWTKPAPLAAGAPLTFHYATDSTQGFDSASNVTMRDLGCNASTIHGAFWSGQSVALLPFTKIAVPSANVFFDSSEELAYPTCGTALTATTVPSVPNGLAQFGTTSSRISLRWAPSTDPGGPLAGYSVYRSGTKVGTSPSTSFTDTGLAPNTGYSYTVSAFDPVGDTSDASAPLVATTGESNAPSVPAGLVVTEESTSSISLRWTLSTEPDSPVAGYNVYRDGTLVGTTPSTSYTDPGLAVDTTYSYRVAAYDAAGFTSQQSSAITATTSTCAIQVTWATQNGRFGHVGYQNAGSGSETNPAVNFTVPSGVTLDPTECKLGDQLAPGTTGLTCTQNGTIITYAFTGSLAVGEILWLNYETVRSTETVPTDVYVTATTCP